MSAIALLIQPLLHSVLPHLELTCCGAQTTRNCYPLSHDDKGRRLWGYRASPLRPLYILYLFPSTSAVGIHSIINQCKRSVSSQLNSPLGQSYRPINLKPERWHWQDVMLLSSSASAKIAGLNYPPALRSECRAAIATLWHYPLASCLAQSRHWILDLGQSSGLTTICAMRYHEGSKTSA